MKSYKLLQYLLWVMLAAACTQTANLGTNQSVTEQWNYEIEAQDTGIQGTYLVKVWSFSEDPNIAINQAAKNAVHGIMFRGFPSNERITGQRALIQGQKTKTENEDYFAQFFSKEGPYQQYVSLTNSGAILPGDRQKIGSGENAEYKIGVVVSVNVADLRKRLEEDNIIKPLDAGF